jgi:hypothetical protein
MAHSNRVSRQSGKAGLTRNQRRKQDYQKLAAETARKGVNAQPVQSQTGGMVGRKSRTNHPAGQGKKGAQHGQQKLWATERRKAAEARQQAWAKLTTAQKIAALDKRLGKGKGAIAQRAQLAALPVQKVAKAVAAQPAKTT